MAKKTEKTLEAQLLLNPEKAGGWLANVNVYWTDEETGKKVYGAELCTAWKNASAGKRWIKAKVVELTPRKSVKMEAFIFGDNSKPTGFRGSLSYKE